MLGMSAKLKLLECLSPTDLEGETSYSICMMRSDEALGRDCDADAEACKPLIDGSI